jgi:uncharacterized membrane protein
LIRVTHQPFSEKDLAAETRGRGSLWSNLLAVMLPVSGVILAVVYAIARSWWIAAIPAVLFFGFSLFSNLLFHARVGRLRALIGKAESVESIEVDAAAAEDVEHLGSNGPAYCFFSNDGQALLLVGQWLLEAKRFPSLKFRVLRMAATGEPIRIESSGEEITPKQFVTVLRASYKVEPIALLRATAENLQQVLDRELTDPKLDSKYKK